MIESASNTSRRRRQGLARMRQRDACWVWELTLKGSRISSQRSPCGFYPFFFVFSSLFYSPLLTQLHCVPKKNIPGIFDCNLKKDYHILIIFDTIIPDTTGHQTTFQFPTSPKVCFCTPSEKQNQQNVAFLSKAAWLLNENNAQKYFLSRFCHSG